jgi:hypothetical protein
MYVERHLADIWVLMVEKLIFALLQDATSTDILMACVDYIYRYEDIWHCMDALQKLVVQLDATQQTLKAQGYRPRLLINLLKLDGGRYLSPAALDRINSDIVHFTSVRYHMHYRRHCLCLGPYRLSSPSPAIQNLCLRFSQRSLGSKMIMILTYRHAWQTHCGSSTVHRQSGA